MLDIENKSVPPFRSGRRLRIIGTTLFWTGIVVGIALAGAARSLGREGLALVVYLGSALPIMLAWAGLKMLHRGRKYAVPSTSAVLHDDTRSPVLYLRAFEQDSDSARPMTLVGSYRYFTEEEQLAAVLRELGPFIAIGQPGEDLPDLGANRIYVEGDWQTKVAELMERAQLVVLRAASSEGFWWEFETAIQRLDPTRILLIVPPGRRRYEQFARQAAEILPQPLPEYPSRKHRIGNIRCFISFGPDWTPVLLPTRRSFATTQFKSPLVSRIKLTLKPIFDSVGVPWTAPPVATAKMLILGISSVILLLASFVWFSLSSPDLGRSISRIFAPRSTIFAPRAEDQNRLNQTPSVSIDEPIELQEQDPFDAAILRMQQAIESSPEMIAELSKIPPEQARARGAKLSALGLRRLDGEALVRRARLMSKMLDAANTTECAALGKGDTSVLRDSLLRLEVSDVDSWFELTKDAMLAEVRKEPAVTPLDENQASEGFQALVDKLPYERAEIFTQAIIDPTPMSDVDLCWTARTLYRELLDLKASHRTALARLLIEP